MDLPIKGSYDIIVYSDVSVGIQRDDGVCDVIRSANRADVLELLSQAIEFIRTDTRPWADDIQMWGDAKPMKLQLQHVFERRRADAAE
jgi:hypothetical protein